MENIILLNQNELAKITHHRSGEIKFGEKIITVPKDTNILEFMNSCEAKFVLFGITEDIGVRANLGRPGTATAYQSALNSLVNIQHNKFCKGSNLLVLGHLDITSEIEAAQSLDSKIKEERKELYFHKKLLNGELPLTIGGGIGQSRLCMLLLNKAHIGEVQASIWPEKLMEECEKQGIHLL